MGYSVVIVSGRNQTDLVSIFILYLYIYIYIFYIYILYLYLVFSIYIYYLYLYQCFYKSLGLFKHSSIFGKPLGSCQKPSQAQHLAELIT